MASGLAASFVEATRAWIERDGPFRWDQTDPKARYEFTVSQMMATRELLADKRLETAYDAADNLVIRTPQKAEAMPDEHETPAPRPYDESPAILALRARHRTLGR